MDILELSDSGDFVESSLGKAEAEGYISGRDSLAISFLWNNGVIPQSMGTALDTKMN